MDNSLSIVTSEGNSNEFPVLKAFQEYIDAEQAKARKRMLGLSVFFIVLLLVVVVTFVLILLTMVNRNQALSDRLLDYAFREREKAPVVQQPQSAAMPVHPPTPQSSIQDILKPFLERLEREQAAMTELYEKRQKEYEKQQKEQERLQKEKETRAAAREKMHAEEIRKVRAELEKEKARLQQENDRQAEIERHRRRLYPEYYRDQSTQPVSSHPVPPRLPTQTITEVPNRPVTVAAPQTTSVSKKKKPSLSDIKPVTYFNTDEDDGVPFLLETPQNQQKK